MPLPWNPWWRIPDWSLYGAVVLSLVILSLGRRENADAPPAPPPPDAVEDALLGPITPFDPSVTVDAPDGPFQPSAGTAFSIASDGRWITARHVVEGCRRPALVVGGGRAVAAAVRLAPHADIALLVTEGGPPGLPVLGRDGPGLRRGQRAFHPGFPQGRAGEVSTRFLGRETLHVRGRGARGEPVLAWAEVGRTEGLEGTLAGLSGAPVMDRQGRVLGVTLAEAPRRGRVYTTAPENFAAAVRGQASADETAFDEPITIDNYGRVADSLRRDLQVAQVVCLSN
ncbi:serine protease [soil metagenome]